MKKLKSIALLVLASAFLIGSLTGCCCPKGPEITSAKDLSISLPS